MTRSVACCALRLRCCHSRDAASASSGCARSCANTQTARASFTQTVTDRNGQHGPARRRAASRSRARASSAGRYEKPYQQIIVGDGERVWIYDPDLNQVVGAAQRPGARLDARGAARRQRRHRARVRLDGLPATRTAWTGSAATPQGQGIRRSRDIRIGFNAGGLAALELTDHFGQPTLLRLFEPRSAIRSSSRRSLQVHAAQGRGCRRRVTSSQIANPATPLAERLRPQTLEDVVGQQHLLASGQAAARRVRVAASRIR